MSSTAVKRWMIGLLIIGYLPVIAYPLTLIAAFFAFAAIHTDSDATSRAFIKTLVIACLVYPVAPIVCYRLARAAFEAGSFKRCLILSAVPIGVMIAAFVVANVVAMFL